MQSKNIEAIEGKKQAVGADASETLVIGSGRLALQLFRHFKKMGEVFSTWNRVQSPEELYKKAVPAKRILLPISDKAIGAFIDENESIFREKFVIHFSATYRDTRALGFHPLGSFTHAETDFSKIHFQGVHPESIFREALPVFHANPYTRLSEQAMQTYHALCVLGGNYSALLWKHFYAEMLELGVPRAALDQYVQMVTNNVMADPAKAVTGPLVRGDHLTIEKNLEALKRLPQLHAIYESFVKIFPRKETP